MSSLSRREREDLTNMVENAVKNFMGFSEPALVMTALNCYEKGYERNKTADKLASILDDSQAQKLVDDLFTTYSNFRSLGKAKVKKRKDESRFDDVDAKKARLESESDVPVPEPGQPSPGQLTADKIKEMMANAQKAIQERKVQLFGSAGLPVSASVQSMSNGQKAQRADDLRASIAARLSGLGLPATPPQPLMSVPLPGQPQTAAQKSTGPTPLILDDEGRTIDATTGQTIQLTHHMPTLKANIRAIRRERFKAAVQEKPPEEIVEAKFFDPRVSAKTFQRTKRTFKFNEPGRFQQLANRLRTKAQLEKLQNEIASAAKKTGIASAAKLAIIQPKKELKPEEIPAIEWWDSLILTNDNDYGEDLDKNNLVGITNLVEHPVQMKAPSEGNAEVEIAVILTKKKKKVPTATLR